MFKLIRLCSASLAIAIALLAVAPFALASGASHTVKVKAHYTVTKEPPARCKGSVCTIVRDGKGRLSSFGHFSFHAVITADASQPPCGKGSLWINRIVRTIRTNKGKLILHEGGLMCPGPGGARVKTVWAVDGADSTGVFGGARGWGLDTVSVTQNTGSLDGTITLVH